MEGSSRGAIVAAASRLAPIGRAIWTHWTLTAVPAFGFAAVVAPNLDGKVGAGCAAVFALLLWVQERMTAEWRELTLDWHKISDEWQALAERARGLLRQSDANTLDWPDFCRRVRDNLPEEQSEAVQYALEFAVAPSLPNPKDRT